MEKKQTAVEWLYERLERMIPKTALYDIDKKQYYEQAKEMEKEQIIDANNQEICSHPDKEFVPGVFGGYWCSKCNRNVYSELEQD
jgi:hypothetical protein